MKRFTLTTVDKLVPGDQFYKDEDKSEIVYTVLDKTFQAKSKRCVQKGELRMTDLIDAKASVIYLGNINDKK